jgi:hypothetical protein
MERAITEQHLAQAERHVAEGEGHVTRQRELVAKLEQDGHDTTEALAPRAWGSRSRQPQRAGLDTDV